MDLGFFIRPSRCATSIFSIPDRGYEAEGLREASAETLDLEQGVPGRGRSVPVPGEVLVPGSRKKSVIGFFGTFVFRRSVGPLFVDRADPGMSRSHVEMQTGVCVYELKAVFGSDLVDGSPMDDRRPGGGC